MKTKKQIDKEIEALKAVRPNVVPMSMFGDDNLAALDAQIEVLENYLDEDGIYDEFDHCNSPEYILESAFTAREWMDDETDDENLADDWPLKKDRG